MSRPEPRKATFNDKEIVINQTWVGPMAAYMDDIPFRNHVMNGATFEHDMILGGRNGREGTEPGMLEPYIKKAKYIVDIGAHTGHHTIPYATLNPDANIYSFEPQKNMYDLLEVNVFNNKEKCENVQIFNLAVGNEHKKINITSGSSAYIGEGDEIVNMIKLDSLNLKGCDYMKIDVEGAEPLVLEGAINTIKKFRPIICYEDWNASENNKVSDKKPSEILTELEYVIHPLVYDNFIAFPLSKSGYHNSSGA